MYKIAAKKYQEFTRMMNGTGIMTEINDDIIKAYIQNEYRSEKHHVKRNITPEKVIEIICEIEKERMKESIQLKYCHKKSRLRALITI